MRPVNFALALCAAIVFCSQLSFAFPAKINYQGKLNDSSGSAVPDNVYTLAFNIYDAASAGTLLWSETLGVQVTNGLFSVVLGNNTPLDTSIITPGATPHLGVAVNGEPEFSPRTELVSAAYAIQSEQAGVALLAQDLICAGCIDSSNIDPTQVQRRVTGTAPLGEFITAINQDGSVSTAPDQGGQPSGWTDDGTVVRLSIDTDSVGIGTASPTSKLDVAGGNFNLQYSTVSSGNILKSDTLFLHNFGSLNTFIGTRAGNLTMIGAGNTGVGYQALTSIAGGSSNTASGMRALFSNTSGSFNTAAGRFALYFNIDASHNTANGYTALQNNNGSRNTAIGSSVLFSNTTGHDNTAGGYRALYSNTDGDNNTATGVYALEDNTTGDGNTATGLSALASNTTGNNNTACGIGALVINNTGSSNTANGMSALQNNTSGSYNTASGRDALLFNDTGIYNAAIGYRALFNNSMGVENTSGGAFALSDNTTGNGNTSCGYFALSTNTTGSNNTAIGRLANVSAGNLINATAIGNGATVDASNKIRLGNADVTVIEGQVAFTFTSDKNQKENFRPLNGNEVLNRIREIELTSWNYKGHDPKKFRHYGPTAQDFFAAFGKDDLGTIGTDTTINTADVVGILMSAVQALEKRTAEVTELKNRMEYLERMLNELQAGRPQDGIN
jgi:hypothetical protein